MKKSHATFWDKPLFLSVIVPCYKQAKTIRKNLENIDNALAKVHYPHEVIVVVDGMQDKTYENAKKYASPRIRVEGYPTNRGKGYAIRYGMARCKGDLIAFIDSGFDLNPQGITMLLEHMKWYDADIVVGSKRHPVSKVDYPLVRRILSIGYQYVVRLLFHINIRDTQTGLKVFRRRVLEDVLPRLLVKRFAFDIEMLSVARSLGYKRIYEAPIILTYDFRYTSVMNSKIIFTIFHMFWDTMAVFYRLRILRYYDNRNKRRWIYDPELDFRINIG